MRIGMAFGDVRGPSPLPGIAQQIQEAAAAGVPAAWLSDGVGWDALTALAAVGPRLAAGGIELGTGVVPFAQRHPLILARQALTTQAAVGGRLTLGIGAGISRMVGSMYGLPTDRPARRLREYLEVLRPLLRGEPVDHRGEYYTASSALALPADSGSTVAAPSVLVAALGPAMLAVAGELADGTITWMTGPRTLTNHVVPSITRASGGRAPRVVAGFAVCLTSAEDAVRERFAEQFALAGQVPEYRAMLDREGVAGPADVLLAGDERSLTNQLARLAGTGATDLMLAPVGTAAEQDLTTAFLATIGG
ncbi:TIGR03564 family F420-dependent LLM class oxidoreductase [Kribbella sp. NPDC050459]|uniref:TIGR03564 family F420-dependent LLM class oxidoreductase n=1 Tax=Kribbella sp. NPDC050459 TaxID=3155785 RepID=UPI0033EDF152